MTTEKGRRAFARLGIATAAGALAALAVFGGPAASSPGRTHATEVRVVTLPIANGSEMKCCSGRNSTALTPSETRCSITAG